MSNQITVSADKTMFGKRTGQFTANLGNFYGQGKTATEAKSALLDTVANYRRTLYVIGTNAGDVFVVTREFNGHMSYSICGKGRSYASGCLTNYTDAKALIERARQHAIDSFDGIAWEHSA